MLQQAFKEWAVICQALAEGRQALILRKGGIAEVGGEFRLEHSRFWLFPTYVHQQNTGIKPEAIPLLAQVEAARPAGGIHRPAHFSEDMGGYHLHDGGGALLPGTFSILTAGTVRGRVTSQPPGA